jgi:hypothetical protein
MTDWIDLFASTPVSQSSRCDVPHLGLYYQSTQSYRNGSEVFYFRVNGELEQGACNIVIVTRHAYLVNVQVFFGIP